MLDPQTALHSAPTATNVVGNAGGDFTVLWRSRPELRPPNAARLCYDCLAAKQSSNDVSGKHKAGKRKVADTGGGGPGPWESASEDTTTTYGVDAPPPYAELFAALQSPEEHGGSVRQWRCRLLSTEGQDVVHQSACI